jgi:hypothetical protein
VGGQVQGDVAAAVAGEAGGDLDQVSAQRRSAGFGVEQRGETAGRSGQVVCDRGAGQSGGVGGEVPGRQVGERPVGDVGEDLLDDCVVAVLGFSLQKCEWVVGEHGVISLRAEQLVLAVTAVLFLDANAV